MHKFNRFYRRAIWRISNCCPKIFRFCQRRKHPVKFFFAGASAATVDLVALYIFHGLFHWEIVLSTSLAFLLSFVVSFSLQKLWTFRNYSQKRLPRQLVLYFLAAFISLNLNGWAMHFLVVNIGVWYLLSQVLVNVVLGIINFFTYKFLIFRPYED